MQITHAVSSCKYIARPATTSRGTGKLGLGREAQKRGRSPHRPLFCRMAPVEQPSDMESEAQLLTALSAIPGIGQTWCRQAKSGSPLLLTVELKQRDLPGNRMRSYLRTLQLDRRHDSGTPVLASFPVEQRDVVVMSVSPSGERVMIVRAASAESDSCCIEVWDSDRLVQEFAVPKAVHGSVYNDGWFGLGADWTRDESRVVYVAESPPGTKTPEWGGLPPDARRAAAAAGEGAEAKPAEAKIKTWKGVGEAQEDWGERNTKKAPPALFVLDLKRWHIKGVGGLPEDSSVGQPVWTPDGRSVICTTWPHHASNFPGLAHRLGIVYCLSRPCALHMVTVPYSGCKSGGADQAEAASSACLTQGLPSAMSPRFSPSGERLVFLSHKAAAESGAHAATAALYSIPWAEQQAGAAPEVIVDVVSHSDREDDFPGLNCSTIAAHAFWGDDCLLLTSQWRSTSAVVAVDLPAKRVWRASHHSNTASSWSVAGAGAGWVVATASSPSTPPQLYVALGECTSTPAWAPVQLERTLPLSKSAQAVLDGIEHRVLQVTPRLQGASDASFEAIVVRSKSQQGQQRAIISPHGGPHSAYVAAWTLPFAFLAGLGYTLVLVNFRGSTGFGEQALQALPGRAGELDTDDCMAALEAAAEAGLVDKSNVAVMGGSHGGFLTGHLIGQHPDAFRAAIMRNPVLDISHMVHVSDIPDWCFVEALGTKEGPRQASIRPTLEQLRSFQEHSPIAYIDRVKSPLLVCLGAKDRRVPLSDGTQYVNALRARDDAPPTRVLRFEEDNHALDKPQTEFEQFLQAAAWLKQHMS